MKLRLVVISAACLFIFAVPTSCTSLLAAAAAVKGVALGAGLAALKTSGGSEAVIIQSEPGSVAEVVPANQVVVQDNVHTPLTVHTAQTITYSSSNPLSRLWGAVANAISAKTKAISELFRPNRIVVVVPHSTTTTSTTTTTQKPLITIDLEHRPLPGIGIEVGNKPSILPGIGIEVGNKPLILPGIDIEVGNKPSILPEIDIEVDSKPLVLPSVEVSASVGPTFRRYPVAVINYLKK